MSKQVLNVSELTVGDKFKSPTYTVTKEEIINFAKKYDPQYFHVDEEAAKDSLFGELVSSGWLTTNLTMHLWTKVLEIEHGVIGMTVSNTWHKPLKPNDTIHIITELKEKSPSKSDSNKIKMIFEVRTFNQDGDVIMLQESNTIGFIEQP